MASNNTIELDLNPYAKRIEGIAAAVIDPGMVVTLDANGQWIPHNVGSGTVAKFFAVSDRSRGKTIDDSYAIGDRVFVRAALSGDEVLSWLAAGETVVIGSYLESNGDGLLRVEDPPGENDTGVGIALEAFTTPASNVRIKILIM